ncbi:MAG: hypothetical protein AAGI52_08390 [Bacteroidota bacterium]
MEIFLWFLLFLVVVAVGVLAARSLQGRRERERLWGSLDGEPSLPEWNRESLGVGPVRVHTEDSEPDLQAASDPLPPASHLGAPAHEALLVETEADHGGGLTPASAEPQAEPEARAQPEAEDVPALSIPEPSAPASAPITDPPRPLRSRPEWWEDDAPGAGSLLRSLVATTRGSAALVRPDPGDGGYLILAAAGPASSALHAHPQARRFSEAALTDLPRETVTVVLGETESGVLPGMEPGAIGETAVRALAPAPAPRRLLIVDVPAEYPLDSRAERLLDRYADLLADVLGLPTDPPPPEPTESPSGPMDAAMEALGAEIATARETGRSIALALVVPYEAEALQEADPEAVAEREAALRQRVASVPGTLDTLPMGALVVGAVCDAEADRAEHWVRDLARSGTPLRIGMALYGPRHVTPDLLRQDAVRALSETYTGEDTAVILG